MTITVLRPETRILTFAPGVAVRGALAMGGVLLKDTFTDTDGTLLTAHTMDVGPGWTQPSGSAWEIRSNQANHLSSDQQVRVYSDAGKANVTYTLDVVLSSFEFGVVFRFIDSANYWYVYYACNYGGSQLWKRVSGVKTSVATGTNTWTPGATYTITVTLAGDSISVAITNGTTLTATDAAHNTGTKYGFFTQYWGSPWFDNFLVVA
jgi:hypothetical protein